VPVSRDRSGEYQSDTSTGLVRPSVAALGIVFGDIGTSPVYTFRECFNPEHGFPLDAEHVGVLSMILWGLILVVAVKYVHLIMRADDQGEGGILALLALAQGTARRRSTSSAGSGGSSFAWIRRRCESAVVHFSKPAPGSF
jgi:KUP system potassium uptake protein